MSEPLLPCPFCGGAARRVDFPIDDSPNSGGSVIECTSCLASGPVCFDRKELLYSSWNERASAPVLPEEMPEAVRDAFGTMIWTSARIANVFRAAGHDIKPKAEEEQAFVLWWILRLALKHGDDWRAHGEAEIKALPRPAA